MWTVGVARSGNELGLSLEEAAELERRSPAEFAARLAGARERLRAAGAHFVIDSAADLLDTIDTIESAMAAGRNPLSPRA
jgi:phosphonoacetaldehyde hydrolase